MQSCDVSTCPQTCFYYSRAFNPAVSPLLETTRSKFQSKRVIFRHAFPVCAQSVLKQTQVCILDGQSKSEKDTHSAMLLLELRDLAEKEILLASLEMSASQGKSRMQRAGDRWYCCTQAAQLPLSNTPGFEPWKTCETRLTNCAHFKISNVRGVSRVVHE